MFRWEEIEPTEIFGMTIKMYRPPFESENTQKVPYLRSELDDYSYRHLGSELYMYMVLDTNWIDFMEARGDVDKFTNIFMPVREKIV